MVHIKFQGHPPLGSREEDFLNVFPYKGIAAILVMWPGSFEDASFRISQETPHEIWLKSA